MNEKPRWEALHTWSVLFVVLWGAGCWLASCTPHRPFLVTEQPLLAEDALTDVNADERTKSPGIPRKPEAWQKPPPCDVEADEFQINGACYQRTGRLPSDPGGCGEKQRQHGERCYRAIARVPRQPTSLEP